MPAPRLDLDQAAATDLFRATVAIIQADPALKRVVRTWEVMDDRQVTMKPPETRMMPWIRVMPGASSMRIAEAAAYGIELQLYVAMATAGLNADNILNLWFAFLNALNYGNDFRGVTVADYLHSLACDVHEVSGPAFGQLPAPDAGSDMIDYFATARVILRFRIPL
jgi:hypothetical protein